MFTTIGKVKQLTGYDVETATIQQAQAVVEAYVGKTESEIWDGRDAALMQLAVSYQAAYMHENGNLVFEQIAATAIGVAGTEMTFGSPSNPYISGLTKLTCRSLSWRCSRSVHTGSMWSTP